MPSGAEAIQFVEEKGAWAKNPLTEPSSSDYPEVPIFFV